ncbi:MAG TPA: hypothetical protein VJO33_19270 [Gemmatimonadaceae bacterium]|nr:hypothetical protein [Gemmatimonadaceae bacterium]
MKRSQYIKPSVLQLDFTTDEEVVSLSSCKSNTSSQQQTIPQTNGSSCFTSTCSSISAS